MAKPTRRFVQKAEKGWEVRAPGAKRASDVLATQKAAEKRAKEIVGNLGGGEVTIKGEDGKIRDSDTVAPGNDPRSSKDKKH